MNHVHHRANLQEWEISQRLPSREARLAVTAQTFADRLSFRAAHHAIPSMQAVAKRMAMIHTLGNKRAAFPRISGISHAAPQEGRRPGPGELPTHQFP